MSGNSPKRAIPKPRRAHRRGAARLAAVQAVYQVAVAGAPVEEVAREFVQYRLADSDRTDGDDSAEVDTELFLAILRGVQQEGAMLDEMISTSLAPGWSTERMDKVLLALLRAGAWELFARRDVPPRVAITEYVDIAHAFFEGKEPGFVNGVMDKLAHLLRPEDMTARAPKE